MEQVIEKAGDDEETFVCERCQATTKIVDENNFFLRIDYQGQEICRDCFKKDVLKNGTDYEEFLVNLCGTFFDEEELEENGYEIYEEYEINSEEEQERVKDLCCVLAYPEYSKSTRVVVDFLEVSDDLDYAFVRIWVDSGYSEGKRTKKRVKKK